jgi:hypothetical protein
MFSARSEPDPQLRRVERRALAVLAILAAAAALSGGLRAVLGVAAGGLIAAISYSAIRAGVDALAAQSSTSSAWRLVKFVTRFAILGGIAYVMMVRLRAQPVWMLLGASSLVAAAALDAVRAPRPRP